MHSRRVIFAFLFSSLVRHSMNSEAGLIKRKRKSLRAPSFNLDLELLDINFVLIISGIVSSLCRLYNEIPIILSSYLTVSKYFVASGLSRKRPCKVRSKRLLKAAVPITTLVATSNEYGSIVPGLKIIISAKKRTAATPKIKIRICRRKDGSLMDLIKVLNTPFINNLVYPLRHI